MSATKGVETASLFQQSAYRTFDLNKYKLYREEREVRNAPRRPVFITTLSPIKQVTKRLNRIPTPPPLEVSDDIIY